ncbi:MAG: hypothetical protein RJA25_570 [Bacteroidota bacterium]|jgi:hypothetical protein
MRNTKSLRILVCTALAIVFINACTKTESNTVQLNKETSTARKGNNADEKTLEYYANLLSPTRDITNFSKMRNTLPPKPVLRYGGGGGRDSSDCYTLPPCNGITFPLYPGWSCDVRPATDTFYNVISYYGRYGSDPRQQYYVYSPHFYPGQEGPNSPIVVLVHGCAWFMGPNPDEVYG